MFPTVAYAVAALVTAGSALREDGAFQALTDDLAVIGQVLFADRFLPRVYARDRSGRLVWVASTIMTSLWAVWFGVALARSTGDAWTVPEGNQKSAGRGPFTSCYPATRTQELVGAEYAPCIQYASCDSRRNTVAESRSSFAKISELGNSVERISYYHH
jgi:hypothetical protein